MTTPRKIAIVGATSGIAEQCALLWAQAPDTHLCLAARNEAALHRVMQHLRISQPQVRVSAHVGPFTTPDEVNALADALFEGGAPDQVLIAHGTLPDQAQCQTDLHALEQTLVVNAVSPALCCEAVVQRMLKAGHGTVGLMGSVAGNRGRQSNYAYGSAKGLLARYAEGLQHRLALAGSAVKVVLIKPGPTDTAMTAHLKGSGPAMASPQAVAHDIVKAMARGQAVVYTPRKWALIMLIIGHLPRWVFHRMKI